MSFWAPSCSERSLGPFVQAHVHIRTVGKETGPQRKGALSEVLLLGGTDSGATQSQHVFSVPAPWKGVHVPYMPAQDSERADFSSSLTGISGLALRWGRGRTLLTCWSESCSQERVSWSAARSLVSARSAARSSGDHVVVLSSMNSQPRMHSRCRTWNRSTIGPGLGTSEKLCHWILGRSPSPCS